MHLKLLISSRILFLAVAIFCFSMLKAQKTNDYNAQWKKIDELVNKGLTKSALTEVDKIYSTAKKDGNDPKL